MNERRDHPIDPSEQDVLLRAEKLIGGGRALAHHDGATWMVTGALPGEKVVARMTRCRAGIIEAQTVAITQSPHPARNTDPCPHAELCGGCDWPHIRPEKEGHLKALVAADAARAQPVLSALVAEARVQSSPLNYRLRARLHWDPDSRQLGFFEMRSNTVTPIPGCRILSPELMVAIPSITEALAKRCPKRVDVEWLQGSTAGDAVAGLRGSKGGSKNIRPSWIPTRDEIDRNVSGFHSLDRAGEIQRGWGSQTVRFELPRPLSVPVGAFFQGNLHLIKPLFQRVGELAGSDPDPVFDLHAGVGFLTAAVLSTGERNAYLAEPHRVAARAAANNLPTAHVAVGKTAEAFIAASRDLPREALVITDPPRTGLTKSLRHDITRWRPRRILMLGCDPATWARDAGHLIDHGYEVRNLELLDLFPSTHHVEILALLERT